MLIETDFIVKNKSVQLLCAYYKSFNYILIYKSTSVTLAYVFSIIISFATYFHSFICTYSIKHFALIKLWHIDTEEARRFIQSII